MGPNEEDLRLGVPFPANSVGLTAFQGGIVFREQLQFGLQPMIEVKAIMPALIQKDIIGPLGDLLPRRHVIPIHRADFRGRQIRGRWG